MALENNRAPLLYNIKLRASLQSHEWIKTGVTVSKRSIQVKIDNFLSRVTSKIWQMTLKNNRAPLLRCFKLCASFHSHRWIQTWVTVRKRSIRVKIDNFLSRVTSKFDRWLWKTIGHLSYAASSFVHHFIANSKLELQSGTLNLGQKWQFFVPCDLRIRQMTLKNNRAPFLYCFKLCASFHSHWWIQTGVTVRKRTIWFKIDEFFSSVTLKFDR